MSDPSLALGQSILGRYKVEKLLGEGAMGQVFKGRHEHLDLPVAIKVLRGESTPDILGRFEREAKLMARVRHPNTVAVQDYGFLDDGSPCLVMEYIEGESLEDRFERCGALPWQEVLQLGQGLLAGLDALHGAGVLHRDLKPSNVVIAPGDPEVPKLIDFGIARPTDGEGSRITRTGVLVGTPAYMAPEQIMCTKLGPRTDLYSLGLMMYELLTGNLPFPTDSMASVMRRLKDQISAPVTPAGRPPIPPPVSAAVVAACSTDESARPANAREFAMLLRRAGTGQSGRGAPVGTTVTDVTAQSWEAMAPAAPLQERPRPEKRQPRPTRATGKKTVTNTAWDRIRSGDVTSGRRYLLAARLPVSELRNRENRRWLASITEGHGRGFTLGAHLWFALQGAPEDLRAAQRRAEDIQMDLEERFDDDVRVQITLVNEDFVLSGAALVGGAPLPEPVRDLITALNE